jgi:tetratricopeptide (TPR) repeat protein
VDLARPIVSVVPGLPGRVLGVLGRSDLPLTGRAVAKAIDPPASQAGVAKVLAAFVRDGIVLRTDAGRSATYVLNREHLAAPFIEGLAELRATFVERLSAAFGDLHPALLSVYLYGSAARGDGDASSDIDIALVVSDQMRDAPGWDAATAEVRRRVHAMAGNEVSLVEYRLRDLFAEEGGSLVPTLRTEGIRLAGASIDELARRWAAQDQRTRDAAVCGRALLRIGDAAEAIDLLVRAREAYRDLDDRYGEASILADLAEAYSDLSRWDESVAAATDAAAAFGDLGDPERQARAVAHRARSLADAGRHAQAVAAYEEALALGGEADEEWRGAMRLRLAGALVMLEDWPRARAECERAIRLFRAAGDLDAEAEALVAWAGLSCSDDPEAAEAAALRGTAHFRAVDDAFLVAQGMHAVGVARSQQGRHEESAAAFAEVVASLRTLGDGGGEAEALWRLAVETVASGRREEGLDLLRAAAERYRESGNPRDEALVLDDLGGAYAAAGRDEEALDAYRQALDAFRRSGDSERTRSTLRLLERLHAERRTAS